MSSETYDVRPVALADAEDYERCHVECLAETYADLMPPAFIEEHRRDLDARVKRTRAAWAGSTRQSGSAGAWLARDLSGEVVGIASSGPGMQDWEAALGAPPSSAPYQLHHLYTRRLTHGTGLGRRLLDVALPELDTYLWILHGNPRADRFYRRHGFVPDGDEMDCGPTWFHRTMYRLVRPAR